MRWEDQRDGHQHSQIKKPSYKIDWKSFPTWAMGLEVGGEEEQAQHKGPMKGHEPLWPSDLVISSL